MAEPLEEMYFNWLCAKVRKNHTQNHISLFRIMHMTEFPWTVEGDRNRAAEGRDLRIDFCDEAFIKRDQTWLHEPCTVLEMLIAFAYQADFQTGISASEWFWEFMMNLNLDNFTRVNGSDETKILDILYKFVWRLYDERGDGGIFPLRKPKHDQRKVELWYQFFEYLDEKIPI